MTFAADTVIGQRQYKRWRYTANMFSVAFDDLDTVRSILAVNGISENATYQHLGLV